MNGFVDVIYGNIKLDWMIQGVAHSQMSGGQIMLIDNI